MPHNFYDITADVQQQFRDKYDPYYRKAKDAHDAGRLELVSETIVAPFDGYGFEVKKGQTVRYELFHGPQIIDTCYRVKDRPLQEWADTWHSADIGAMTLYEGMVYFSNTPYVRPLLTIIKDTVDNKKIREAYGEGAAHSFVYNSGRCSTGIYEAAMGISHCNSCDVNMLKGMYEIAGEEVARMNPSAQAFMHFQIVDFLSKIPTQITFYPMGRFGDFFERGDYVELLAHQDLYAAVSTCPMGDQNDKSDFKKAVNFPVKVKIFEGADGPLETAPDPEQQSPDPIEWIKAGLPDMVTGVVGEEQF